MRKIDRSTYYGWDITWGIPRKLQPGAAIFGDVGPDVRWVGNEKGMAGETSWETYTPHAPEAGKLPGNGFTKGEEGTEGHRDGKYWMPAECDVPFRPGWFYHASQDGKAKTARQLLDLYYKSVGRSACLDLGLEPNRLGLISDDDVTKLTAFGRVLKNTFADNLAAGAVLTASNVRKGSKKLFGTANLLDDDRYSYWATDDTCKTPSLIIDMPQAKAFDIVRLRENIKLGQRIEGVAVDVFENGVWREVAIATSIGANKLIKLGQPVTAAKVRIRVTKSPVCIALSDIGLFKEAAIEN